jgi:hypothetical protein
LLLRGYKQHNPSLAELIARPSFFITSNVNSVKMRFIEDMCPPALLYLLFIAVQLGLDLSLGLYVIAALKAISGAAGVYLLEVFCEVDLGVLSWVIIATPFIMTALATSIALGLNLDHLMVSSMKEHFNPTLAAKATNVAAGEPPSSTSALY